MYLPLLVTASQPNQPPLPPEHRLGSRLPCKQVTAEAEAAAAWGMVG